NAFTAPCRRSRCIHSDWRAGSGASRRYEGVVLPRAMNFPPRFHFGGGQFSAPPRRVIISKFLRFFPEKSASLGTSPSPCIDFFIPTSGPSSRYCSSPLVEAGTPSETSRVIETG